MWLGGLKPVSYTFPGNLVSVSRSCHHQCRKVTLVGHQAWSSDDQASGTADGGIHPVDLDSPERAFAFLAFAENSKEHMFSTVITKKLRIPAQDIGEEFSSTCISFPLNGNSKKEKKRFCGTLSQPERMKSSV